ncbi:hypothetical protein CRG98_044611 [Punica granatum]|uniref:Beta-glucosidase 17-like n=1 Tax=Punica granatum TaxID=22663 RepID=A0A2I0HTF7_PUNGR|nr:hypothetical protein CRG98_044611 [Punica granatum]
MTGEKYPPGIIQCCCLFSAIILLLLELHCCTGSRVLLDGPEEEGDGDHDASPLELSRASFPHDFTFGVASSAYQKDIPLLKEIGWDFFRFSISWPRLVPNGKVSKGVNQQGINFYNSLIDELLAYGIQPFVTLFHWDVPQTLEDKYGGFLSREIVDDFHDYADLCFKEFGDRVKYWTTLNEPNNFAQFGYATGTYAPGRCSNYIGNCTNGNSATEPYIVAHHLLLSHASVVQLYRSKYQTSQKGKIGLGTSTYWMKPKFPTDQSRDAAMRALDFQFGWIVDPITFGDYPKSMRNLVGTRLPNFTIAESKMLRGSYDYLGVNYYTARYVDESTSYSTTNLSYTTDGRCNLTTERDGITIGKPTPVVWIYMYPKGIRDLMHYVKNKYNPSVIYILENGVGDANNVTLSLKDALRDTLRMKYHKLHLFYLSKAIEEGVNVKGYLTWSFLDNFSWALGYTVRYGVIFIDYKNGLKRYPKDSSLWFKQFLRAENTTHPHI